MKGPIPCQCADPDCGPGPCPRSATAEDLKCDYCRANPDPWPDGWIDPNHPSAVDMIIN